DEDFLLGVTFDLDTFADAALRFFGVLALADFAGVDFVVVALFAGAFFVTAFFAGTFLVTTFLVVFFLIGIIIVLFDTNALSRRNFTKAYYEPRQELIISNFIK
ncbi:MAG: hypothetical protein ACPGC0_02760, partial [Opitutales bacterium]